MAGSLRGLDTLDELLAHPMINRGWPPRIVIKRELDGQMFGSDMSSDTVQLKWYAIGNCAKCGDPIKVCQVHAYTRGAANVMGEFTMDALQAMAVEVEQCRRSEREARAQVSRMAREQAAIGEELRKLRMRTPRWLRDWKKRRDRRRR